MVEMVRKALSLFLILMALVACAEKEAPVAAGKAVSDFKTERLTIPDADTGKVRGQVLYVPIYSNIPCRNDRLFDLSAFIAIHNTDVKRAIRITHVLYFDNDGRLVMDFLPREASLPPLGATNYFIPKTDKSGTGANFLVEWRSDAPVSEPLVESVMLNCEIHKGIAFTSKAKVIREIR